MKQVIVITGASSGFGALTARSLALAGHTVYASMRETKGRNAAQVKEVEQYATEHKVDLRTIELDVASQESCDSAIQQIIAKAGRLDAVIHNAGHMVFGPAEAFTPEQYAELYDVNVLSAQRVNRSALPQLRKQGKGLLVWVSSSSSAGGTLLIWHPTSPRKLQWIAWPLYMRWNSHVGASRHQLSFRVPLPAAPITSRMPDRRTTKPGSLNTKRVRTKVLRTKCAKASQRLFLPMRMSRASQTPSSK
jgi:NAD(P)-dependent dehydrogenase (short-subunit alcohol dehydrogenase family)